MRKVKRHKDFDIELQIKRDGFISPPREGQRNWLLSRAIREFADDLVHLDQQSRRYVGGADTVDAVDRAAANLHDSEIMEDWQVPIMKAMADIVGRRKGSVLEIGFGRGIASGLIQKHGPRQHTIVECNPHVIRRFWEWMAAHDGRDVRLIEGRWQDVTEQLDVYDAIFFHTYPLTTQDFVDQVVQSRTFAEHFFPTARAHLSEGGVFTYLTNEADSLSRGHQRLIFEYFSAFSMRLVGPLAVPEDTHDAFWSDTMAVVEVVA